MKPWRSQRCVDMRVGGTGEMFDFHAWITDERPKGGKWIKWLFCERCGALNPTWDDQDERHKREFGEVESVTGGLWGRVGHDLAKAGTEEEYRSRAPLPRAFRRANRRRSP